MTAITLTIPPAREFHDVAHLVLGGLGSRLHLTVEDLEDLQIALGELLARQSRTAPVTLEVVVEDEHLNAAVGPFDPDSLVLHLEEQEGIGLRRVLEAVVDQIGVTERDGAGWVRLTKTLHRGDRQGAGV